MILRLLNGKRVSRCLSLAAELGVADQLREGPLPIAELAARAGALEDPLFRVLRMLAGFGVFTVTAAGEITNNAESELLLSDADGSLRDYARWFGVGRHWRTWEDLDFSVESGLPAIRKCKPEGDTFSLLAEEPEAQAVYSAAMAGLSVHEGRAIMDAGYDWGSGRILDVGGGQGVLAKMIAESSPEADVTVLDLPHVIESAEEPLGSAGVQVVAGSFFEPIEGRYDLCVIKHVLHNWDDLSAERILCSCRDALDEGGRVLVCEFLIGEGDHRDALVMDVAMLVGRGGRERTRAEWAALLERAGLRLSRVQAAGEPMWLIEAVRA